MQKLIVRRADLKDAPAIHRAHMKSIQELCSKDYSAAEIEAWGKRDYREEQRFAAIKDDFVWVVECDSEIEGFGHLKIQEKEGIKLGHIFGLYLTIKVAGQKQGLAIFQNMLKEIKSAQVKKVTLESTITALSFYHKIGFINDGPESFAEIRGTKIRCFPMKMEF